MAKAAEIAIAHMKLLIGCRSIETIGLSSSAHSVHKYGIVREAPRDRCGVSGRLRRLHPLVTGKGVGDRRSVTISATDIRHTVLRDACCFLIFPSRQTG